MRILKLIVMLAGCLSMVLSAMGQGIQGYNVSNYAGVSGVILQPASIADSRYKVDITLMGGTATLGNDFISITRKWYSKESRSVGDWRAAGLVAANTSGSRKNLIFSQEAVFPSFMVSFGRTAAIAFTARERFFFNLDHVNADLANLADNKFYLPQLYGIKLNNDRFNINTMAWNEYGFSYAQVINNKGPITMKAGVTLKIMQGLGAAYFYARDLNYAWRTKDTLDLFQSNFGYGTSDNFQYSFQDGSFRDYRKKYLSRTNLAPGLDFGFVMEWRPHYKDYMYDLDGKEGLYRKDQNKYKLRLGASILDLGRIKFKRSKYSADFHADIQNWVVGDLKIDGSAPINSISDTLKKRFGFQPTEADFTMTLPTAISIQADYHIYKAFYLNFTSFISPRFIKDESKVHALNYYSLGPRWDSRWFGVMLPLSMNGYSQIHLGTTLRIGSLIVGTSNIGAFLFQKKITGYDLSVALKVPIFQPQPRDRDKDGISNRKDKCPDIPGTKEGMGCPDKDGDGVADKDDECPEVVGLPTAKGCPDFDNDGVPDKDDKCPAEPGIADNSGCPGKPDRDHDGVEDSLDRCPDSIGATDHGGCPDTDNDGVYDDQDACPKVAGTVNNKGCPLEKKEEK
jgi:hypothetical protein